MPSEERPGRVWLDQLREFVERMDPRALGSSAEIRAQAQAAQRRVMAESAAATGSLAAEHIQRAREAMQGFQDPYRHTPGASYWINELNQLRNQRIDSQGLALSPPFTAFGETPANPPSKKKKCTLFIARQTLYNTSMETVLTHIRDACKSKKINLNRAYTFETKPSWDTFKTIVTIRQLTGAPRWLTGDDLIRQWYFQQAHTGMTMAVGPLGPEFLYPGEEQ